MPWMGEAPSPDDAGSLTGEREREEKNSRHLLSMPPDGMRKRFRGDFRCTCSPLRDGLTSQFPRPRTHPCGFGAPIAKSNHLLRAVVVQHGDRKPERVAERAPREDVDNGEADGVV